MHGARALSEQFPTISEVRELKAWGFEKPESPGPTILYTLGNFWGDRLVNTKVLWGGERAWGGGKAGHALAQSQDVMPGAAPGVCPQTLQGVSLGRARRESQG